MPLIYYISHPDVVKDPAVPVPRWPLSARGGAGERGSGGNPLRSA